MLHLDCSDRIFLYGFRTRTKDAHISHIPPSLHNLGTVLHLADINGPDLPFLKPAKPYFKRRILPLRSGVSVQVYVLI
jgi:hypothetical protein